MMVFGVKYIGRFVSRTHVKCRVEILQEGYAGAATEVTMSGSPLMLNWKETDKLEPVQSSSATIELLSKSDRQFINLYTVEPGTIRMDVYRDNILYWSGMLDPELYSEPYSFQKNYFVQFTFSDFAILERKAYEGEGFKTLRQLLSELISATGLNYSGLVEHISTTVGSSASLLDSVSVQSQNFYDEDHEAMSLREVLDEVLRPFPMRLIQKNGKIHLYDLNALSAENAANVVWKGTDAILENDVTYNNVKLTYSPYEKTTLMDAKVDHGTVGEDRKLLIYISYHAGSQDEKGFHISLSDSGVGLEKAAAAKFFKIDPIYSGSEEAGIAWSVKTLTTFNGTVWNQYLNTPSPNIGGMLFRVPDKPYLSYIGLHRKEYKLKVSLDVMFDARYNPFEGASKNNEENQYKRLQDNANFAYVPIKLTLRNEAGTALYHFENHLVKDGSSFAHPASQFKWVSGEAGWGDAWLCWYRGNRKNESGLGDWQTNKQIIGYYREELPTLFDKMGNGEFIDLPDKSGYLEFEVGTGLPAYDYGRVIKQDIYNPDCKFLLYRNPKIEIVDKNGKIIDKKDIEYTAWINKSAKEDLEINTILGTMPDPSPAALGQFFDTSNYAVRNQFSRGGVTDLLEKLLIGTVYSSYSGRHIVLSGTTDILTAFGVYSDKNQAGKYLILSEEQDVKADHSKIKMVQFEADNYQGVEYIGD